MLEAAVGMEPVRAVLQKIRCVCRNAATTLKSPKTSKTTFNNDQQGKKLLGKTGWMGWLGWMG